MENRKSVNFVFVFLFALLQLLTLVPRVVSAYEEVTHVAITKEVVHFYNQYFRERTLTGAEAELLMAGSFDEDATPRWMNHYYDPIHNTGLTKISGTWLSSKAWAHDGDRQISIAYNPVAQTTFAAYAMFFDRPMYEASDFTWERAIRDYAAGNTDRGLRALGHIVHLIEDASVPDHTRNDPHVGVLGYDTFGAGSPYELWAKQFTKTNIDLSPYLYGKAPVHLDTLDEYFDGIALYSNKHFYSKDTINDPAYLEPRPQYYTVVGDYEYGFLTDEDGIDYRLVARRVRSPDTALFVLYNDTPRLLDDGNFVLRDYWERLAPKAVQYGAGVIDLFFREVKKAQAAQRIGVAASNIAGTAAASSITTNTSALQSTLRTLQEGARRFLSVAQATVGDGFEHVSTIPLSGPRDEQRIALVRAKPPTIAAETSTIVSATNNVLRDDVRIVSPPLVVIQSCVYDTTTQPSRQGVVLNEIAWMGTAQAANNEWIELKNISDSAIDITGWQLRDRSGQIAIRFVSTTIASRGFVLLERTDDQSVPNVKADVVYVGSLGNTNEGLRLFTNACVFVDEVIASPSWPAGDVVSRRSMERNADFVWYTYTGTGEGGIFGTPRAENSSWLPQFSASVAGAPLIAMPVASLATTPATTTATVSVATFSPVVPHVLISEIRAGVEGNLKDEFVELYNPTDAPVDLRGFALKKRTGSGEEVNLVSASAFVGVIAAHSFFLIAHEQYTGAVRPDIVYSVNSNNFAYANNTAVLYGATGTIVDEIGWSELQKGQSFERKALFAGGCVVAQSGVGIFLGNGCDTDSTSDFDVRALPDPQNSTSLSEPRVGPVVTGFHATYDEATLRVAFWWDASLDVRATTTGMQYVVTEATNFATTTIATTYDRVSQYVVTEVGRDYRFTITAVDRGGLSGPTTETSITVPSFLQHVDFYHDPITLNTRDRIDVHFSKYPFIPSTIGGGATTWKGMVFYFNSVPIRQTYLNTATYWQPAGTTTLPIQYPAYTGQLGGYYATLLLPDIAARVGMGGGLMSAAMSLDYVEDGKFSVFPRIDRAFASTDYFTVAYYDFAYSGSENQTLGFIATDATKFFFNDTSPINRPPTMPGNILVERYDNLWDKLIVSFDLSTDVDDFDRLLEYQVNILKATSTLVFDETKWFIPPFVDVPGNEVNHALRRHPFLTVERGHTYVVGARARDPFGNFSPVAVTAPYEVALGEVP